MLRSRGRLPAGAQGRGRRREGALYNCQGWDSLAELRTVYVLSCGVTVVKAVRNERKQNTGNEFVMQSPILEPNGAVSTSILRGLRRRGMGIITKK